MALSITLLIFKIVSLVVATASTFLMWQIDPRQGESTVQLWNIRVTQKGLLATITTSLIIAVIVLIAEHVLDQQQLAQEVRRATEIFEEAANAANRSAVAAEKSSEAVERIEVVMRELLRVADPINRIEVSATFSLPMQHPTLAEYKKRLDRELRSAPKGKKEEWCKSWSWSVNGVISGANKLTGDHIQFPGNSTDGIGSELEVERIELALYKDRIIETDFFWSIDSSSIFTTATMPTRPEPDLAMTETFNAEQDWCLVEDLEATEERYYLQLAGWSVDKSQWARNLVELQYLRDLPGAQLFFHIGGQTRSSEARREIGLQSIEVSVNGKPLAIGVNDAVRYVTKMKHHYGNGHPYWVIALPREYDDLFH